MGILDQIRSALGAGPAGAVQFTDTRGLFEGYVLGLSPEDLYRTQPHLRTVISFLARNTAQLGLHCFERVSDTDRRRTTTDPVAQLLRDPNPQMTTFELIYSLVANLAVYDEALWVLERDLDRPSGWTLQPIPPSWIVKFHGGTIYGPDKVDLRPPGTTQVVTVPANGPAASYIHFHGWDPQNLSKGSSPISALKATLLEQIHAVSYRDQLWKRSGRVGLTVKRAVGAPEWDATAKKRFMQLLDAKLSGNGPDAGGNVLLEDGMELERLGFNAKEEQFVEAAKLAFSTVASVYHVNPTMVGQLDNANFSNVREFRRMLYGETLGPILSQIQDRLNTYLVPRVGLGQDLYLEFNIQEKLKGSFEEQASAISTLVGRPIFTANEGRALYNRPDIAGGDELVTPLNVLVGGQASPRDADPAKSGPMVDLGELLRDPATLKALQLLAQPAAEVERLGKAEALPGQVVVSSKDRAPATYQDNVAKVLKAHFERQGRAVVSALGAKGYLPAAKDAISDWWDSERWDRELGEDLARLSALIVDKVAREAAVGLGFAADDFDMDRVMAFLAAVSARQAQSINEATRWAVTDALEDPDGQRSVEDVFTYAAENRSVAGAATLLTMFSALGTIEAGKQLAGDNGVKVWRVNSKNSRHTAMDGQAVPLGEKFSNGADWPGDPELGVDDTAGCLCSVEIIRE